MRLEGRKVLVTGAASGIGAAIAALFHREGARLALLDRDEPALATAAAGLPGAQPLPCDVADGAQVEAAVKKAAARLGSLDGIVNVAGVDLFRKFDEMSTGEWERVLAVNLTGPMFVCRAALPFLKQSPESAIVNIASGAALRPLVNRAAYCASKAGLAMFSKALALEFAQDGIRVNVVCPGVIDTPLLRDWYDKTGDPDAARSEARNRPAMARLGQAEDIAYAALHLTSTESRYTTGSTLVVDGGRAFY